MADTNVQRLAQQILASSDSTKWQGEGFGSAQANAEDMAKNLISVGITDISQFGAIPTYQKLDAQYVYQGQPVTQNADGSFVAMVPYGDGYVQAVPVPASAVSVQYGLKTAIDDSGNSVFTPIDPSKITTQDGQVVGQTGVTYGNIETGQKLGNTYGERQVDNAWGGTYAGKGNTAYRVQFDAQGKPHFYTTGASSSDIGTIAPILAGVSMALGVPGLLGSGLNSGLGLGLGTAGQAALGGATFGAGMAGITGGDVLTGAALGGVGGYLSGALQAGITDNATLQAAMDADIAGGLVPEYGTNAAYDSFMNSAMTPAARLAIETQMATGNGAWLGENVPSGVPEWDQAFTNAGGTFDTAYTTPTTTATRADLPQASYSNEGRNYRSSPESTQGTGGSPANASVATAAGLPLVDTTGSGLNISPSTALNAARLAAGLLGGGAVAGALTNSGEGSNVAPTQGVPVSNQDYYNAIQQYYNTYLPTQPRDVAGPLQQWYNKSYGTAANTAATSGTSAAAPAVASVPTTASVAPIATASGGLLSAPAQTVTNAAPATFVSVRAQEPSTTTAPVLSPAQQAYADYLSTQQGQGSPSDINNYVRGLNDYQSLMSLANVQGRSNEVYTGTDGSRTIRELSALYNVPIVNYGQ